MSTCRNELRLHAIFAGAPAAGRGALRTTGPARACAPGPRNSTNWTGETNLTISRACSRNSGSDSSGPCTRDDECALTRIGSRGRNRGWWPGSISSGRAGRRRSASQRACCQKFCTARMAPVGDFLAGTTRSMFDIDSYVNSANGARGRGGEGGPSRRSAPMPETPPPSQRHLMLRAVPVRRVRPRARPEDPAPPHCGKRRARRRHQGSCHPASDREIEAATR